MNEADMSAMACSALAVTFFIKTRSLIEESVISLIIFNFKKIIRGMFEQKSAPSPDLFNKKIKIKLNLFLIFNFYIYLYLYL